MAGEVAKFRRLHRDLFAHTHYLDQQIVGAARILAHDAAAPPVVLRARPADQYKVTS